MQKLSLELKLLIFAGLIILTMVVGGGVFNYQTSEQMKKEKVWLYNELLRPVRQTQRAICRQTLYNAEAIGATVVIDTNKLLMFDPHFLDSMDILIGNNTE